jgi:hypothetical protein
MIAVQQQMGQKQHRLEIQYRMAYCNVSAPAAANKIRRQGMRATWFQPRRESIA